jgi:hypothetical protein
MKKPIFILMLASLFISQSLLAQSCPLTNTKLTDLRIAAMKLSQKVSLSPQCQKFEEQVNEANANLTELTKKIGKMSEGGDYAIGEKQTTALAAVTQLNSVTAVFNDKTCGKELVGFLDYVDAFADVASGIAPFLALYGGPESMPWAIGTALAATTVKSVINFFKSKTVDMKNPEQSAAFIQNSCSFYNLDMIKSSIDDLQMNRFSKIEKELEDTKAKLVRLDNSKPEKPNGDYSVRLENALRDRERLAFLSSSFSSDPLEACVYIGAYANGQDGGLINRVWDNYYESIKKENFRAELEYNYFHNILNSEAQNINFAKCKEFGSRWLAKVESMSKAGIAYLDEKSKELPDVQVFDEWTKLRAKVALDIEVLETKIKYLHEMMGDGFDIEYSEIIKSHDQVKDALFMSYKYLYLLKFKGLAEAWLSTKQESAWLEYRDFFSKKKEVYNKISRVQKTMGVSDISAANTRKWSEAYKAKNNKEHPEIHNGTHTEICNQLRQSWTSWNNGYVHARAGKTYCLTFDKVISQMDYPAVQRVCFGTSSRVGYQFNSLKNQVRDFDEIKHEADEVVDRMNELRCSRQIKEINQEALSSFQ